LKDLLNHIEQLKTQLEKLQPLSIENQQKLDKKFRLEWNYNSNHIEGNTLTYGETELLLIFDLTKGNHEMREYEEMKGHDVAL
jgi:Fic family protein